MTRYGNPESTETLPALCSHHLATQVSVNLMVECPGDIVDAIGGWKTSGVGHGYGNGYPLEVLEKWMNKFEC